MAGRPRTEIDKDTFINTIVDAESEQTFPSRAKLFEFIGEVLDIPSYTVTNRVREWGVVLKTELGKRGRPAGVKTEPQSVGVVVDLSELLAAFAPLGIKCSADIIASPDKSPEQNERIRECYRTLRELTGVPPWKK